MNKLLNWFRSHMEQTKVTFFFSFCIIFLKIYFSNEVFFNNSRYAFSVRFARFLGEGFGQISATAAISLLIGWFVYLIFHENAEKYKRYLDYVAIVFLFFTIIIIIFPLTY